MKPDRMLRIVVFPVPVPPEMMTFSRARTMRCSTSPISGVSDFLLIRSPSMQRIPAELADRNRGPSSDSGGMMALTREPSGRRASTIGDRLVDAATDSADDAVDDLAQVDVVAEAAVGPVQLARALHVDVLVVVDQDVGDRRVVQQRFQRAVAEHLVLDVDDELFFLPHVERDLFLREDALDESAELALERFLVERRRSGEIENLDDALVDASLELVISGQRRRG